MQEKLSFDDFVERIKSVRVAIGVRDKVPYVVYRCEDNKCFGIRLPKLEAKKFKIDLKALYEAYCKEDKIDTAILGKYKKVIRNQSPAYAILKEAGLA